MDDISSIHCLPDEIIFMVLKFSDINEIVKFSLTCKRFNELIYNNQSFWREIIKISLPVIYETAEKHCNGLWLQELKRFVRLKQRIYDQLMKMPSKHYWKMGAVTLPDLGQFFSIASKHNRSYFYTIYILQDLIRKVNENTSQFYTKKPFTLTEMFYAKIVLRHLIHCYLCVKWVKYQSKHTFPPEKVVNYFIQWIDTHNLYFMEDVEEKLQEITNMVKEHLKQKYPTQLKPNRSYTPNQVLAAVSYILFDVNQLFLSESASLDSMNIIKIFEGKIGHKLVLFAMYQAVSKRAGVHLELIVFADHLFLEWTCPEKKEYKVNIRTGAIEPKRRCPFSSGNLNPPYKYAPDSLLQGINSSFIDSQGPSKKWPVVNATDLLGFLGGSYSHPCPYDNFYPFLYQNFDLTTLNMPLDLKCLTELELEIISSLTRAPASAHNKASKQNDRYQRAQVPRRRDPCVTYAVGMICSHKVHDYVGVILSWDLRYDTVLRPNVVDEYLHRGYNQPFYKVMALDHSERYVAQENIIPLENPIRLGDIEEFVGGDFSYFDGFCYVLNDEKAVEYPQEEAIVNVFRQRYRKFSG